MPKKSTAQLDRDIAESLGSKVPKEIASSVAYWKEKWGHSHAPTTFPKTIRQGAYTARFTGIANPNTAHATAQWEIKRGREVIGVMHEGWGYGWGKPTISLRQLTWSGPLPPGTSDPRSPHYGWTFDIGVSDSYKEAMQKMAKQADRLIAWRKKHGKVVAQGVR